MSVLSRSGSMVFSPRTIACAAPISTTSAALYSLFFIFLLLIEPILWWVCRAVDPLNVSFHAQDDIFGLANLYCFCCVVFVLHFPTPFFLLITTCRGTA